MTEAAAQTPQITGGAYLKLIGLGALIGIPAALLAAGFLALIHELENVLWHELPDALGYDTPPWYLVLLLPVVGAALVLAARRLLPGDGGHRPVDGFGASSPTPVAYMPGVALAAIGSLAFGAVLGPEAPLIALGSAVGLAVTRVGGVAAAHHRLLASRLRATQAEVDPAHVIDRLEWIGRAYEVDPDAADAELDELIRFLRDAIPRIRRDEIAVAAA